VLRLAIDVAGGGSIGGALERFDTGNFGIKRDYSLNISNVFIQLKQAAGEQVSRIKSNVAVG